MNLQYTWIADEKEFFSLSSEWKTVFKNNNNHSVFLAWEWVSNWWKIFGDGKKLAILCAREESTHQLIAIVPLYNVRKSLLGVTYLTEWKLLGADSIACSDHLGILTIKKLDQEQVNYLFNVVWTQVGKNGVLYLTDLHRANPIIEPIIKWAVYNSIKVKRETNTTCPGVQLSTTWNEYLMQLSSNFRSQVRSSYRKVLNNNNMTIKSVTQNNEIHRYINDLVNLNISRMGQKNQKSSFLQLSMQEFLENLAIDMIGTGNAWLDILLHDNRLIAASFHLLHGNTVYYYQGGFDTEYAKWRPSTVLFAHVIQRAIDGGYGYFDFLRGDEKYKYRWGAKPVINVDLLLLPDKLLTRTTYVLNLMIKKSNNLLQRLFK